jgi:hypothetical protein
MRIIDQWFPKKDLLNSGRNGLLVSCFAINRTL